MTPSPGSATEARAALVTGASRGIGAAVARRLAASGRPVGIGFRQDGDAADAVVADIVAAGGEAVALRIDVADAGAVDRAFATLEERFGPVLVLVNSAGTASAGLVAAIDDAAWRTALDVNLSGAFITMRRALGGMLAARSGRIVNIGSVAARRMTPGQAAYASAKAGLEALTRAAAVEVGRRGVTVNTVAPGYITTDMLAGTGTAPAGVPAQRPGTADEVAACVCFLTTAEAAYVNGATLVVDGGLSAALPR